ncbi:putative germin-like protein 2-1 [Olea europaea var. sylvestris]|uniref:Germin-like protein n=1 Tax=Olea europaea subsp. europaea TaxID=158383 RepID=A0A8S0Q6H7_OLEEU|nr:putative germin-like protein 2-1 [Olea europaea var. sylvestris]CAA2962933.1 germin 2-1 [Olea europaea subsp. europaea]
MVNLVLTLISLLAIGWTLAHAGEPSPLQDFCVADFDSPVRVNGHACLDPKKVTADHFFFFGLHKPGNTSNPLGSFVNRPTVDEIPGLNTLGISTVRVDYAPRGVVPPHRHPRASEILIVLEGEVLVGFVTSDPENKLFSKVLKKGDVFAFPFGLIHFQQNVGHGNAVTIAFLSSQNPGVIPIANTVFGSNPSINDDLLAKAFRVDKSIIRNLKSPY